MPSAPAEFLRLSFYVIGRPLAPPGCSSPLLLDIGGAPETPRNLWPKHRNTCYNIDRSRPKEDLMPTKHHEGSLHGGKKKKKRVKGTVDRITGGIVVVLIRHPDAGKDEPDTYLEIYVPRENFKNRDLKEGDYVSVDIEQD
jgi:hypothetical protein